MSIKLSCHHLPPFTLVLCPLPSPILPALRFDRKTKNPHSKTPESPNKPTLGHPSLFVGLRKEREGREERDYAYVLGWKDAAFLQRRVERRHHTWHLPPHFRLYRHQQDVPPRALRRGSSAEGARKAVVAGNRHSTAATLSNTDARSVMMIESGRRTSVSL